MADSRGEPTMEDILASIRRIISEDPVPAQTLSSGRKKGFGRERAETAGEDGPKAPDAEMPHNPPADFETHLRAASQQFDSQPADEGRAPAPRVAVSPIWSTQPENDEADEEVLELTDLVDSVEEQGILSAATVSVAAERLQQLSDLVIRPEGSGATTLEDLVRDMLRPMMKQWLDANLPDIVDQVVSREIARLTGKSR